MGQRWYHSITFDHTLVPAALTNVSITLVQGNFSNDVKTLGGAQSPDSTGKDIRFYTDAALTTQIPFDLINFTQKATPANARIEIIVNIPSLSNTVDTTIYVGWGDTSLSLLPRTDTYGRNNAYKSGFKLWCPMRDDPDTSHVHDRTVNDLTGTKAGAANPSQVVDAGSMNEAQAFVNANGSYISFPAFNTGNQFTVFCPFNFTGGEHGYQRIVSNKNVWSDTNGFEITLSDGSNTDINVIGSSSTVAAASVFTDITTDGWENFAVKFNGTEYDTFLSAVKASHTGAITSVTNNSNAINIGDNAAHNEACLDAQVDPIIIYVGVLSDAEIQTMQNNQRVPTSFVNSVGGTTNAGSWFLQQMANKVYNTMSQMR